MVELLATKPDHDQEGPVEEAPRGPKGQRRRILVPEDFEDLHIDLVKNIQLKSDEEGMKERRVISITPRELVEKEGSEEKAIKVKMFTGVQHSRWDLLAAKEDFRINRGQYVLETGFLGEELNADNVYQNLDLNLNLGPEDSLGDHTSVEVEAMEAATEFSDQWTDSQELPDLEVTLNNSRRSERAGLSLSSRSSETALLVSPPPPSSSQSPLDPWQLLDPHQELRAPKPLKIKATRSLPPSLRVSKKTRSPIVPISQFLSQQIQPTDVQLKSMPSYIPLSCYDLLKRQRRLEKGEEPSNDDEVIEEEVEDDVAPGDNEPGPGEEDEEESRADLEDFHLPDPNLGGDLGAVAVEQVEAENDSLSYEELVARRVEQFLTRSREAMKSSELSQKVANWHEMIGPRLENLEKRKPFDIHAYGSQVIRECEGAGSSEVPFREIVRGQKKEEISR